ncbi:flavin reductase family protein [Virgibacillus sp. YIM 98842]|uniref:flavin reductase family protein n=1 Tax=Virgibacillus sp. YIM 98842 TaxID=2663533 RepID=UPI0013DB508F|nr:flavin reductase family protein [Virgibacillus sp. YIM 98842]
MDSRLFRDVMGQFATGITIVSTKHDHEIQAMTVNAFMSVSLEPKLVAVSIDENASMYPILQKEKKFGISILSEEQKDLAMICARQKEMDREIPFIQMDGVPVIDYSIAVLSCKVDGTVKAGDHMIFIAEVTDLKLNKANPLLFHAGKYKALE